MPVITQSERHATERGAGRTAREMVLDALQERFPAAPATLRSRVSEMAEAVALRSLFKVVLRASSIRDIEQHLYEQTR